MAVMYPIFVLFLFLSSSAFGQELNNPNGLALCAKGAFHNCWGTQTYPDGTQSSGEWKNGLLNGMGITNHADGDKYIGEFKAHKKHGQGIYIFKKTAGGRLEGIFEHDKFIRAAKVDLPNFNDNVAQESKPLTGGIFPSLPKCQNSATSSETIEKQKRSWNNCIGVIDTGAEISTIVYKNGLREGVGMVVGKESGYRLLAKWERNFIKLDDVEIIYGTTQKDVISYKGAVNGDLLETGNGVMHFKDGTKYVGQFLNGAAHGFGKKYSSNGQVLYEGRYVNGYPENKGSSASGGSSIFMDQLLRGGGLNCHQIRSECRQTNNYYACIESFNRSRPSGDQTCNP